MKKFRNIIIALWVPVVALNACKKDTDAMVADLASMTVVNAAIDVASAKSYVSDKKLNWSAIAATDVTTFANFKQFAVFAGNKTINAVNNADTTKTLYTGTHNFTRAELNTLFLCGQPGSYEGVLLAPDNLPNYKDTVVGVRVINLSPNSPAVNVVLTGTPMVNEFSNLSYKQLSDFKKYPATRTSPAIGFQVRNAATGAVMASYSIPLVAVSPYLTVSVGFGQFKNITLVIKGLAGTTSGTNAFGVFPVPHY